MTRTRLDLSEFDDTPSRKDPSLLHEISSRAGFPSRPATPPVSLPERQLDSAPSEVPKMTGFRRPARPIGNRHITINARVDDETAQMLYSMRDADPSRRRALADIIEEATRLLYERDFEPGQ